LPDRFAGVMARRISLVLAGALALFLGGVVRDLAWHATHDTQKEFETASTQVAVHWLLWAGALALLVVSLVAFREDRGNRGYALTLAAALAYVPLSVWHFIEHANRNDPQLVHVFIYIVSTGMVVGACLALYGERTILSASRRS
jgi:FtsH-binding integral membrane protein